MKLAKEIGTYIDAVAGAYDANPEQKSIMLLTVMDGWMLMDTCATKSFRILKDYSPGFPPELLDVLQISDFRDMLRLRKIQNYINERHMQCKHPHMTVFTDPTKSCFAEQFFNLLKCCKNCSSESTLRQT